MTARSAFSLVLWIALPLALSLVTQPEFDRLGLLLVVFGGSCVLPAAVLAAFLPSRWPFQLSLTGVLGIWVTVYGAAAAASATLAGLLLQLVAAAFGLVAVALAWRRVPWRALDVDPFPALLAWAAAAISVAYAFPNGLEVGGVTTLSGYWLQDGLWFSGNVASVGLGLPLDDFRMAGHVLHYQYPSLVFSYLFGAALEVRHFLAMTYVAVPLLMALAAALSAELIAVVLGRRARGWMLLGALSATFLTDGAVLLQAFGGVSDAWTNVSSSAETFLLGNRHNAWMLVDPPFTFAVVFFLAGALAWTRRSMGRPGTTGLATGLLWALAGLGKGVLTPLLLPPMLLAIAVEAAIWVRLSRGGEAGHEQVRTIVRPMMADLAVLAGVQVAAFLALAALQGAADYSDYVVMPWYLLDYVRQHFTVLAAWPALASAGRLTTFLVWAPLAILWLAFVIVWRPAEPRYRLLWCVGTVSIAAGITVANLFTWKYLFGAELYFPGMAMAISAPLAVAGAESLVGRSRPWQLPAGVCFAVGLVGGAQFLLVRDVAGSDARRDLGPEQAAMLDFVREQTPPDARFLYFRYTIVDNDPRKMTIPFNEQYHVVSGWGERAVYSEGSYYGVLFMLPELRERRAQIDAFYGGRMTPAEASAFLDTADIDYVLWEPGATILPYQPLLEPSFFNGRYGVFRVLRPDAAPTPPDAN